MTDPIKAEPVAYLLSADGKPVQVSFQATYQHGFAGYTEAPLYTEAQLVEERRLAWNEAIEAAAAYVDGNGGTVIPGATVFAALVSGNFQPCMSGDARDRLPPHTRRRFDAATHTLTQAIRALTKDSTYD